MRLWVAVSLLCFVAALTAAEMDAGQRTAPEERRRAASDGDDGDAEALSKAAPDASAEGTDAADIQFRSWNELYDYLQDLEEELAAGGVADEDEADVQLGRPRDIRLELVSDGDSGGVEDDGLEDTVEVRGTITEMIREVAAPDLTLQGFCFFWISFRVSPKFLACI